MTPKQLVALVDAAMRSSAPPAYLDGVAASFDMLSRTSDAEASRGLGTLFEDGEIEMVLSLRAAWKRVAEG